MKVYIIIDPTSENQCALKSVYIPPKNLSKKVELYALKFQEAKIQSIPV